MKVKVLFSTIILSLFLGATINAQGFQPPSEGKAVVYFVRVTKMAYAVSFEYFHNDKYIGAFKKQNYMRYECDPGDQLFWASTENKYFVASDLKAGGTYIIIVDVNMGVMKARVGLSPITEKNQELFDRAKSLINDKAPIVTPQEKVDKMNKKLAGFIEEKLETYNEVWKHEKNFNKITSDMAISEEAMK